MASNPSHLEAVSPVVEGIVRAKQDKVVRPPTGPKARSWLSISPTSPS
jgi:2-oxoglutarate decarboxylase